jgi:hypothetical protein
MPQFVGNKLVRCLRTITHPTAYCQHKFQNIYYLPVEKRHIQDIRINILNMQGEQVPFKDGREPMELVLHFGRVSPA